jgi:HlyD family secretion protein
MAGGNISCFNGALTNLSSNTTSSAFARRRGRRGVRRVVPTIAVLLCGCSHDEPPIVGTVERDRIELTATYAEPIARLHVREGAVVKAGDLLCEQDPDRLEAQQRGAEGERDQLRARLAELVRGPRKELIREAMARVDRLEALRRDAEREQRRLADLKAKGFVSQSQLDSAVATFDAAAASLKEANATLSSLVAGTTAEELDQARSALRAAEARVDELAENRQRLDHVAPMDGTIEAVPYKEGETPPIGAPVVVMLRGGVPYARVYVPEPLRAGIKIGDAVEVRIDGVAAPQRGRVRFVSSDASFTPYYALTRYDRARLAYVAEIDIPDGAALPAGVPVEVHLNRGD